MRSLAIIIPTFNRKIQLKALLAQLFTQIHGNKINCMVCVVNDNSTDGTLAMLESEFPEVHVVKGREEWWFTKSVNKGLEYLEQFHPDFILTINDDVKLDEGYLENVQKILDRDDLNTIFGSIAVYKQGDSEKTFFDGYRKKNKILNKLYRYNRVHTDYVKPVEDEWDSVTLPARGLLIPSVIANELHGLDEGFVQYFSDHDFCERAQESGYTIKISHGLKLYASVGDTCEGSLFKKEPFSKFISSYFNRYSRNYFPYIVKYNWRHNRTILYPLTLALTVASNFKAFFFNKKI